MGSYQQLETYREFIIMGSITEKPMEWIIGIKIGVCEDAAFIQKFGSINQNFAKGQGAMNCSFYMLA